MQEIFGYIERITFQNPENGYTVVQLKENKRAELSCVVGVLPGVQPGMTIRCRGDWKQHRVFGKQFCIESYHVEAPADLIGIKKYLSSGLIKGIGPEYAERIVTLFKAETLNIIEKSPERLFEVEGLGKKRVETIKTCWSAQKSIREVMVFLQAHGVSPVFAQKIFKTYGDQSIAVVKKNPYQLAQDIYGIGFQSADLIAQNLGLSRDSAERIDAGIEFILKQCSTEGHVCFPAQELTKLTAEMLEINEELIHIRLKALAESKQIEKREMIHQGKQETFIWLRPLFLSEIGIQQQTERLRSSRCFLRSVDVTRALEWVQNQLKIKLADHQQQAVKQSLLEKMQIITGGPGTGKSTITRAILAITEKLTDKIILAAPTGRAAKRMSEITGKKARTIHSLLEYDFRSNKFKKGLDSPLDCDLIVIDEASMIDTSLMWSLLKAIPDSARVIFVGDVNQLPSVGPGNVLKDMICSQTIPVTILTEIFRQAAGSRIITNAHLINSGTFPDIKNLSDSDFYFLDIESPEEILRNILDLVTHRLPKKYAFNAFDDIQVLAPMKRGVIGIENLNQALQEQLNPPGTPLLWGGKRFLPGDKVMQIRNNYQKEVYNGDIGRIVSIDAINQEMLINFDGRAIPYEFSDLDEIVLAYAVSVHKYQGSECPCIIMPIHTSHFKLLYRNLLYTGVTRGKKLVILVGTKKALSLAVKNDEVKKRYTALQQALNNGI